MAAPLLPKVLAQTPYTDILQYPAKTFLLNGQLYPGTTLFEHSIAVAYVAMELYKRLPRRARRLIRKDFPFIASVHDIGKICPGWMIKYGMMPDVGVVFVTDHSEVTEAALNAIYPEWKSSGVSKMDGGHHGSEHRAVQPATSPVYGDAAFQKHREDFARLMEGKFGSPNLNPKTISSSQKIATLSLISISDWIASDEANIDPKKHYSEDEIKEIAKRVVDQMGWDDPEIVSGLSFKDVFPSIAAPNKVQKAISGIVDGPGVYIVEAATGDGKTETALWSAYNLMQKKGCRGAYFALPTRVTSNRMHERVLRWVEKISPNGTYPRVIHGQVEYKNLPQSKLLSFGSYWFSSNRRALLERINVGTVDQVIPSIMNVRYYYIRLFALINKFVIIDEVHSYDAYTGSLIQTLVRELSHPVYKCAVVILSATLTRAMKAKILDVDIKHIPKSGFPAVTYRKSGKRSISIRRFNKSPSKTFDVEYLNYSPYSKAVDAAAKGANVVWFENTVDTAAAAYSRLSILAKQQGVPIGLLHSRFVAPRRNAIEGTWIDALGKNAVNRPNGCILVCTQVVEQSLDVDFDLIFTRIAPGDILIQRLGRVWRHDRVRPPWMGRPKAYILGPDLSDMDDMDGIIEAFGKSALVYDPYILVRTAQVFSKMLTVELPKMTRRILERIYREPSASDKIWVKGLYVEMRASILDRESKAKNAIHGSMESEDPPLEPNDIDSYPTRKESVPTKVMVLCRDIHFLGNGFIRLELYTGQTVDVPVNPVQFKDRGKYTQASKDIMISAVKAPETKAIRESQDQTSKPLSNICWGYPIAVVVDKTGRVILCSLNPSGYEYSDEKGLIREI